MSASIILAAYLIGSIPFSFLLARRRGIDLRLAGSGNVGASNVFRTSGVLLGVLALALDGLKGALAVLLAQGVTTGAALPVAAGLAAMVGHIYPVWLRWQGGKGVATAGGVFLVLAPMELAVAVTVFLIALLATRIVSVGSVSAALTLPVITVVTHSSRLVIAGAWIAAALIVYRHRGNLARLLAGTERRVGGA